VGFFKDIFAGQFNGWRSFLPSLNFKDFKHASNMFVNDNHARAPKFKFLYYVDIQANPAMFSQGFTSTQKLELNMLVKRCDLPSYDFTVNERNAYNKRTYNYARIKYSPVNIHFHDDTSDVVNAFWRTYYQYMVQDGNLGAQRFQDDKYKNRNFVNYGIDESRRAISGTNPISSITIYCLNRRRFVGFKLINPVIDSWKHDTLDAGNGDGLLEQSCRVLYEAVEMSAGSVAFDNPKGFATIHYDKEPSPLKLPGNGPLSILGEGGLLDTGKSIFSDITNGNITLGTLLNAGGLINNLRSGNLGRALKEEGAGVIKGVLSGQNPLSRFGNLSFPSANSSQPGPGTNSGQGSVAANNTVSPNPNLGSTAPATTGNLLGGP